jgi:hypothetical protein
MSGDALIQKIQKNNCHAAAAAAATASAASTWFHGVVKFVIKVMRKSVSYHISIKEIIMQSTESGGDLLEYHTNVLPD